MTVNLNVENILIEQTVEQVQQEFKDNPIPFKEWIGERNEEWMQSHLDLTKKVIKVIPEEELQSESIQRYFGVIRNAGLMKWQEPQVRELVLDQVGKGRIATAREVMSASGMPEPGVGGFQGLINLMQQLAPPSAGNDNEDGDDGKADKPEDNASGASNPFPQGFPFPMPPNGGFGGMPPGLGGFPGLGGMPPGLGGLPPGFEDMSEEELLAKLEAEMPGFMEFLENLPPPDELLAMLEQKLPGITEMLENMPPPGELMGSFPPGMPGMPGFPMPNMGASSDALFAAVEEGDPLVLQDLINRGVNLDARDDEQRTALHAAAESGNADLVRVLVEGEAAVGLQDAEGCSPLHLACVEGNKEVVEILLENDANPMQRDNNGCTALHLLAFHGNSELVAPLIDNLREYYDGNETRFLSAINTADDDGDTPLSLAVEHGHDEVAEILRDLLSNVV